MSRQGFINQTPPLFLSQRQYQQLERSFNEPIQRQVIQLQAEITDLQEQVKSWKETAETADQYVQTLQEQITTLQAETTRLQNQLQTANTTITRQEQQITDLQSRIAELEAVPDFPTRYIEITNNRSFTTDSAVVCFSFQGGYGGLGTIATCVTASGTYDYLEVPKNAESATILYNSINRALSFYIDTRWSRDVMDIQGFFVQYNPTTNDRIMALY